MNDTLTTARRLAVTLDVNVCATCPAALFCTAAPTQGCRDAAWQRDALDDLDAQADYADEQDTRYAAARGAL